MAATKQPNPAARELHLAQVAHAYCQGLTQAAIAQQAGVTQQQISYDLKVLQKRWRAEAHLDLDAAKGRELAKIDHLEREAWAAWERSKMPREEQAGSQSEVDGVLTKRTSIRKRDRDGSAVFLDTVRWCIERRCAIFGLDAPTKVVWQSIVDDAATRLAGQSGLDKSEVVALAQEWLAEKR